MISTSPVPEIREMVAVAKQFIAGEVHFSMMVGPTEQAVLWSKVHGTHPAIQKLARDWQLWADQVWNEYGQHKQTLTVDEYRRRVAADLGMSLSDDTRSEGVR
jgi:hypothetical protein